MDRVEFVKESIVKQEERLRRELIDKGELSGEEGITRTRCNAKSMLINNPYAYNDARMASYFDERDRELYCFTSDLFEGLIKTRKNPYNNNPLPNVFIETIKAQLNILKYLKLNKPRENKKVGDALKEIFDERPSINNRIGEEIYYDGLVLYRLYTGMGENDYRTNIIDKDFKKIGEKFIKTSFFYCVDINNMIHTDFLRGPNPVNYGATISATNTNIYPGQSSNVISYEYGSNFKITEMFQKAKYLSNLPRSGFNEISFRIISKHISMLNDFYTNGKTSQGQSYYTDKTKNMGFILEKLIS